MSERILLVDDDENILNGFKRNLRKEYEIEVALGGKEAIDAMTANGPFAAIVSDLQMPGMNGIEFLVKAREIAPDTVRMMLTGNADLDASINAVNEGHIFRFLTKPCPSEMLKKALDAGVEQYRLVTAEKELLGKTLSGSVKLLTDILSLTSPAAFGKAIRARKIMGDIAGELKIEGEWEFELSGTLSQTGCVTFPTDVVEKIYRGDPLNIVEKQMFESHPQRGHDLIENIPRLENIAKNILYQEKQFNGMGIPEDDVAGRDIPLGARALHLALSYDTLIWGGRSGRDAVTILRDRGDRYDPSLIGVLERIVNAQPKSIIKTLKISELISDMVLADDVVTSTGKLLVAKGQVVTPTLKERLVNFARIGEVSASVVVTVRVADTSGFVV